MQALVVASSAGTRSCQESFKSVKCGVCSERSAFSRSFIQRLAGRPESEVCSCNSPVSFAIFYIFNDCVLLAVGICNGLNSVDVGNVYSGVGNGNGSANCVLVRRNCAYFYYTNYNTCFTLCRRNSAVINYYVVKCNLAVGISAKNASLPQPLNVRVGNGNVCKGCIAGNLTCKEACLGSTVAADDRIFNSNI